VLASAGPGASLFGHSSGAIYALEAARRFPISQLMLYEPPLRWRGPEAEAFLDRLRAEVDAGRSEEAATIFFREEARLPEDELPLLQGTPRWKEMAARAWTCVREWTAILSADLSVELYRDVPAPTLLLAGTVTRDHPSFATWELEATMSQARVAMLDGQGHMAHVAAPDLVASEMIGFLDMATL
jgi:pimeloyl-ACP methyl ester carboxylesterase